MSSSSFKSSLTEAESDELSYSDPTRNTSQSSSYDDDTLSDRTSDNFENGTSNDEDGRSFSANISSDEDDSFIVDDDDTSQSISPVHRDTLHALEPSYPQSLLFDQPTNPTIATFLTEYHDKPTKTAPQPTSASNPCSLEGQLLEAAEQGNLDRVTASQRSGANVHCVDKNGRTAMHIACSLGHIDIVKYLIESGANVDAFSPKSKQTPLHEACIGGHTHILNLLLSEVADLDVVDHLGRSGAHYCAMHGERECLEFLCCQGCDVCLEDSTNRTGVHFAAMHDHCEVIQVLIERGADLDVGDREGKTPAHYAARYGSIKALETLMKNAVEINQGDVCASLPTHEAAYYDKLQCLKLLIKKGVKCSVQDDKGRTILHKAAQGKSLSCLHWILSTGKLDANTRDSSQNTALHYAAANGFSEGFYCLLQHKATASKTALEVAQKHGKSNAIKKAVDGQSVCKLCCNSTKATNKCSSGVLDDSKRALFQMPEAARITQSSSTASSMATKKDNIFSSGRKSEVIPTSNHYTLAAKYYGPST